MGWEGAGIWGRSAVSHLSSGWLWALAAEARAPGEALLHIRDIAGISERP